MSFLRSPNDRQNDSFTSKSTHQQPSTAASTTPSFNLFSMTSGNLSQSRIFARNSPISSLSDDTTRPTVLGRLSSFDATKTRHFATQRSISSFSSTNRHLHHKRDPTVITPSSSVSERKASSPRAIPKSIPSESFFRLGDILMQEERSPVSSLSSSSTSSLSSSYSSTSSSPYTSETGSYTALNTNTHARDKRKNEKEAEKRKGLAMLFMMAAASDSESEGD